MSHPLDHPQLIQLTLESAKRKRKSWKGINPIRKSVRLNKASVCSIIAIDFSDDESYHEDFEDNDDLKKASIGVVDDESYHGGSKDNENLEEEILENITHPLENKWQLTLYHYEKSNGLNLTKDKLRLVQKFMGHLRTFYRFTEDSTIAYSLNTIYKFLITNNCKLPIGASIFEIPLVVSVAPYQYRIARDLREQEMDHP